MNEPPRPAPRDPFHWAALAVFLVAWVVSCIGVPYPEYLWLQHVPTAAAIAALVAADWRWRTSRLSSTLVLVFLGLHLVGARYLYSYVPYDAWIEGLLGIHITRDFGFMRNHYDRLVHWLFGMLLVIPAWRFARRIGGLDRWWAAGLAFSAIMGASAVYEVAEWGVAVTLAPDWAESYNGQQGDPWDAQWDMALAMLGSLAGLGIMAVAAGWRGRRAGQAESNSFKRRR